MVRKESQLYPRRLRQGQSHRREKSFANLSLTSGGIKYPVMLKKTEHLKFVHSMVITQQHRTER